MTKPDSKRVAVWLGVAQVVKAKPLSLTKTQHERNIGLLPLRPFGLA